MFFLDEVYLTRATSIGLTSKYAGYYITNFAYSNSRIRQCIRTLDVLTSIKMVESDNHLEDYIDVHRYKHYVDQLIKKFYIKSFIACVYPFIILLILAVLFMVKAPYWLDMLLVCLLLAPILFYSKTEYSIIDNVVEESIEVAQNIIDDINEQHKHGINHHYRSKNHNILNIDTSIDNQLDQANYQVTTRFTRADFDKAYRLGFCTNPTTMNRYGYTKQLLMIATCLQHNNIDHPVFRQVRQIIFKKRFFTVLASIVSLILFMLMIAGLTFIPSSVFEFDKLPSIMQVLIVGVGVLIVLGIAFFIYIIGENKFSQIPKAIKECLDTYYPDK